jgi:hypothetical protein
MDFVSKLEITQYEESNKRSTYRQRIKCESKKEKRKKANSNK